MRTLPVPPSDDLTRWALVYWWRQHFGLESLPSDVDAADDAEPMASDEEAGGEVGG